MRTMFRSAASTQHGWRLALIPVLALACACPLCAAQPRESASLPAYGFSASGGGFAAQSGFSAQSVPAVRPVSLNTVAPPIALPVYPQYISPEALGDLMMVRQHYLDAIDDYQRALFGRTPKDAAVLWNKLGIAYQHMYALKLAKVEYEKSLSLKPHYANALNNLGTVYYGERNYGKAEKYYRKAIHLKPKIAAFYSNLGTAYFSAGKYKQGIKAYRKAFTIDPNVFLDGALNNVSEMGPASDEVALNYALARLYAEAHMFVPAIHYLRMAYMDGFTDNHKLMHDAAFAALRATPQFRLFMTEERIPGVNPKTMVAGNGAGQSVTHP